MERVYPPWASPGTAVDNVPEVSAGGPVITCRTGLNLGASVLFRAEACLTLPCSACRLPYHGCSH